MEPIFVASPSEVYRGDDARERLAETNDLRFVEGDSILHVDHERWRQAQEYERVTWMDINTHFTSDRNEAHALEFGNYTALPFILGRVLEIGCGPFTNMRLILTTQHLVEHIDLLDPLIEQYINHPNCAYADGELMGVPVECVASSIEAYTTRRKFDIVVMINVLPHCYDAEVIFEKVPKLVKKGGYLVWAEFPTMPDVALADVYDVGHPLKIRPARMNQFLDQFTEVYRKGWYFIGTKP